jgi:hypothetical protein
MSTLQIGFFGLRNAGKTVGATVLYLTESGDGLDVTVGDEDTVRYLRPLAEALERGDVPSPTMGAPTHLKWQVSIGDARHDLETTDFPGELLETIGQEGDPVTEEALAKFRRQVRDWFARCDAILLFIDSTQSGTVRYRDALVRILEEMSRRPTLRGNKARAVGVVFTKGDRVADSPQHLDDEAAVKELLARHPLYEVVQRRLREFPTDLKTQVFLSSALGWNFLTVPEKEKQRRKVEPCNWFAAVRWAVEQAAALVEETHKEVLDELEQEVKKGWEQRAALLTSYPRFLRWLDDADRQFRLSTGPCAGRLAALRGRLVRQRRNQKRLRIVAGAFAVLFLLGVGYRFARQAQLGGYDSYERLTAERPGEPGVRERLAYYDEKISPRGHDWFWLTSDRRRAADARAESDRGLLARVVAEEAYFDWSAADERLDREGRQPHRHAAATAYLQKHGTSARPERAAAVARVADQTRPAYEADQDAWQKLASRPAARPEEYEEKYRDLLRYAGRPDALQAETARALAETTRLGWDEVEYRELRELGQKCTTPDTFARLESAATDYLRPNRHTRTMANPVEGLAREVRKMRQGKDYWVLVEQVHIPDGSDLHAKFFGFPNCSVKIALGGQSFETKPVKPPKKDSDGGFTVAVNQRLGPYHAAWGPETATVTVVTNRGFFPNNVASESLKHDELVLSRFNGRPVEVTCRLGKTVTVSTDCPDARPPALPAFNR